MIKLIFVLRRRPELSRDEFRAYWRDHHAPLVKRHARKLRIRRYVQAHTLEHRTSQELRESRQGPEPYDGVAELWWDSLDDIRAAVESTEAREAGLELLEDERNFIDLKNSPIWLAEEHAVWEDTQQEAR